MGVGVKVEVWAGFGVVDSRSLTLEKKVAKVNCRFTRQRPLCCFTFILFAIANCRLTRLRSLVIHLFSDNPSSR